MSFRNPASPIFFSARLTAALTAAAALLAQAPEASACDCAFLGGAAPSMTSVSVPTNAKVWVHSFGCSTPSLRKTDGTAVTASMTSVGVVLVLHPDAPLEMGSTYEVVGCSEDVIATFTVNAGPDNEPPPRPSVSPLEAESGSGDFSSCGSYEYVPLLADQTDAILTLDIAGHAALDPKALSGGVSDVFFPDQQPIVGSSVCGPNNWDFESGPASDTRLGAFDYAGNFSGWSDPQSIETGCGCEAAGADPARSGGYGLVAMSLLGAAALRRRRQKG